MADTYSPILGFTLPEVGASRDTWGSKLNHDLSMLDSFVGYGLPVGMTVDFAGPNVPTGWLLCDGRAVSRTTYALLFQVLGSSFGSGDGTSTFNLPNLCGRATVGPGSVTDSGGHVQAWSFALAYGYYQQAIPQSALPNYQLSCDTQGAHNHGGSAYGGNHNHGTDVQGSHAHGGGTSNPGDHSHTGYTDAQGLHSHNVYSGQMGNGAAGGYANVPFGSLGLNGYYTDQQGNHQHNVQTYNAGNHTHSISTDTQGAHAHNITYSGTLYLTINTDGSHTHNVWLGGGGQAFVLQSPALCLTKIIFCGWNAIPMPSAAAQMLTIDGTFEDLDELRQELADLKAMVRNLLAQPQRRLTTTRGAH
jgi:microcystin-dependent protein